MRFFTKILNLILKPFIETSRKLEYKLLKQPSYLNERSVEYSFTLIQLLKNNAKKVLDIGTGKMAFPALMTNCGYEVTAADEKEKYWNKRYYNPHYHVISDDICTSAFATDSYEAITCISVLEHIENYKKALSEMVRIVKPGGIIIITCPYSHAVFCENVYKLPESDELSSKFNYICRSYSDKELEAWTLDHNLTIQSTEYFQGWTGPYWRTGERITFPKIGVEKEVANGICLCLKVN